MPRILDNPEDFATEALDGMVAANPRHLARVDGGVVRSTGLAAGLVAVVIGGGSGHYPAFAGLVGAGLAAGSACGNIFASPAVGQIARVARAADAGGGVLLSYGNYAGDVLNFGQAEEQLRAAGIDARTVLCTDDIASAPEGEAHLRRGVAGDFVVFKIAGAAAESGRTLDEVERLAREANARTRSLGVAFAGTTLPGADAPLFTIPPGRMAVGLGIHGEPGLSEVPLPSASELADLLVSRLLAERPAGADSRVVPLLNGLGTVTSEELFLLFGKVVSRLEAAGLDIVEPECGQLVTSLDMSGISLTLFWPDDVLAELWSAPADSPAYRKGAVAAQATAARASVAETPSGAGPTPVAEPVDAPPPQTPTPASRAAAEIAAGLLTSIANTITDEAGYLGRLDSFAGDGDHGIGMTRGAESAAESARDSLERGLGVEELLRVAAEHWSESAGGTSGALWSAALGAVAASLGNRDAYSAADAGEAARAALGAVTGLGHAAVGDKTMVDAMAPFAERLTSAAGAEPLAVSLRAAAAAARDAAESTAQLMPKLGRARPHAEKSLGHPDAGAVSFALIVGRIAAEVEAANMSTTEENA